MAVINPSIPVVGQPNSSEEPKIVTALTQLVGAVNNVDSSQIVDGTIVAGDLSAACKPATLLAPYRPIFKAPALLTGLVATTYFPNADGSVVAFTGTAAKALARHYIDPADFAVSGLTANMKLRVEIAVNGTAPACNFSFNLYPIAAYATAAGQIGIASLGSAIAGAAISSTTPGAGVGTRIESADFAVPSGNYYVVGVAPSGAMAAGSAVDIQITLLVHHV